MNSHKMEIKEIDAKEINTQKRARLYFKILAER